MKKLNRKGFTLVELLAVIVILAIVVGIAIPGISGVIQGAKSSALHTQVQSAADWLSDQMDLYNLDQTAVDKSFTSLLDSGKIALDGTAYTITDKNFLAAMGFTSDKITQAKVCITSKGKVYVEATKVNTKGDYYTTENWKTNGQPNYTKSDVSKVNRAGNATPAVADGETKELSQTSFGKCS